MRDYIRIIFIQYISSLILNKLNYMNKLVLLLMVSFLSAGLVQAQEKTYHPIKSKVNKTSILNAPMSPQGDCDTLGYSLVENQNAVIYVYGGDTLNYDGYLFGPLNLGTTNFLQSANVYSVSGTPYKYITGAQIFFGIANTNNPANLNKKLSFRVYERTSNGIPGQQLGSTELTLAEVKMAVDNNQPVNVLFPTPIAIPADQTFFVSVDYRQFKWTDTGDKDSIAVLSTYDDSVVNSNGNPINLAYQNYKLSILNIWAPVTDLWVNSTTGEGLDVVLYIFPFVSVSPDGCTALPVTALNFTGVIKNNQALLTWSTATENNNKGFYVERSADGKNFTSIGFVKGNGTTTQVSKYNFTDVDVNKMASNVAYYRLRQIDFDGKEKLSSIIKLDLNKLFTWSVLPNPFVNEAFVQLQLNTQAKVQLQLMDASGKLLQTINKGILSEGSYSIPLNIKQLTKGTYYIRMMLNDETFIRQVIK